MGIYTVVGTLRVRTGSASTTFWNGVRDTAGSTNYAAGNVLTSMGSIPDQFRDVVLPPLPPGFRTESMEYAVDETGTRLAYTVVMFEEARVLPGPAKKGTADFVWNKSLQDRG